MSIKGKENVNHELVSVKDPNWPKLLSDTVDDLSRILRIDIELLELKFKRRLEAQIEKVVGVLILLVALIYGSLFLLGGAILLLHWWLAWWLSMLITGSVIVIMGIVVQMRLSAAARKKGV
jgi:hypothetical protein